MPAHRRAIRALVCAWCLGTSRALAAPGDLDPTFGGSGVVLLDRIGGAVTGRALALQPDGRIVVAGIRQTSVAWFYRVPDGDFFLARFGSDGMLDRSFGTGGVVITPTGGGANVVVVQPDGKIVAAGSTGAGTVRDVLLVRYEADGTLDDSFGSFGMVTLTEGNEATGLLALPDGRLVVAGGLDDPAGGFLLARYDERGSLDPGFGSGGVVTTPVGLRAEVRAIDLQPDGMVVAAGGARVTNSYTQLGVVARYLTNGSLDPRFGGGAGNVVLALASFDGVTALALQPDGRIVAAGFIASFAIQRLLSSGALDVDFDGIASSLIRPTGEAVAVGVDPAGRLVVTGGYNLPADPGYGADVAVARYRTDGTLDPTFGTGGLAHTTVSNDDQAEALVIQPDGKILVTGSAGGFRLPLGGGTPHLMLLRYQSACETAHCSLDEVRLGAACAGQVVPESVASPLDRGAALLERASREPARKARRLRAKGKRLLRRAARAVTRAAASEPPSLPAGCAGQLGTAISRVVEAG